MLGRGAQPGSGRSVLGEAQQDSEACWGIGLFLLWMVFGKWLYILAQWAGGQVLGQEAGLLGLGQLLSRPAWSHRGALQWRGAGVGHEPS